MKLGEFLHFRSQLIAVQLIRCNVRIPMCQAGHDLAFDILLYVLPLLAILGWARRKQLGEIAGLDIREDATLLDGIVIVDDY